MSAKGLHRLPGAFSTRRGKAVGLGVVASLVAALAVVLGLPAVAAGPVYPVMNTSETPPDGVWFRDDPAVSGPRLNGYGVYAGDRVELRCYGWGETLGPYRNRLWYYSANVTRPNAPGRANVGWLNAHYVNDGQNANVAAPGVPACGGASTPPPPAPGTPTAPTPVKTAYGAPCATTTMIVIPGSGETNAHESTEHPVGKLSVVTQNLRSSFSATQLRIHYIPYPSQIVGTDPSHGIVSYDWSRAQGYGAAWTAVKNYAAACPATRFVLLGYSQGAHIAGDLTATMGIHHSPVDGSRILATSLLGDAARDPNYRPLVGMTYSGQHGIRGSRGIFGVPNSKVTEYCAAHDPICDAGGDGAIGRAFAEKFKTGPHTSYDTALVPGTSTTYTQRMANDLRARM